MIFARLAWILITVSIGLQAFAETNGPSQQFADGVAAIGRKDYSAAETTLAELTKVWPQSPDLDLFLGIARYHQGKYLIAALNLDRAVANGAKYMSRALYYSGLVAGKLGDDIGVQTNFKRLIREYPDSNEALIVAKIADTINDDALNKGTLKIKRPSAPDPKPVRLIASLTMEYDDRVASPDDLTSGTNNADHLIGAAIALYPYRTKDEMYLKLDAFADSYFEFTEYNYAGLAIKFGKETDQRTRRWGYVSGIGATMYGGYYFDSSIETELSVPLSITDRLTADAVCAGRLSAHHEDYAAYDGLHAGFFFRWDYNLGDDSPWLLTGEIGLGRKELRGVDWRYSSARATIDALWQINQPLTLYLSGLYEGRLYDEPLEDDGAKRVDQRIIASFGMDWRATDRLTTFISIERTVSASDNQEYHYRSWVAGTGVRVEF